MKKILIALLAVASLAACRKEDPQGDEPVIDEKSLVVVKYGITNYVIAYSNGDEENAKQVAAALSSEVSATLKTAAADSKQQENEILLGKTGRTESADLLGSIGSAGYGVKVYGKKIVIAGTDECMTARALFHFQDSILFNKSYVSGKTFQIPKDYSFIAKNPDPVTFSEVLKRGHRYTVETKLIGICPEQGNCYVSQGAASDGKYVWFVMRDNKDTEAVICQYTLNPFAFVAVGETFDGGHCNDLTYDDNSKKLVLAHGQSQGKILTLINSNYLSRISDIEIPVGAGAITFNKSRNQYAVSQGGSSLHILSSTYSLVKSYTRRDGMTSTYVAQGMGSDDDYIYFPMSPSSGKSTDNILVTYDWKGNFIDNIHIDLGMESESMFCVNGKYYVNFYNSRSAKLYQIIPSVRYKYKK